MLIHLADVSIRSFILVLPAAIVLWLLRRRRTAALQHAVWTAVVCGMLALFAFGQVLPRLPLRILGSPAASAVSAPSAPMATIFELPMPALPAPISTVAQRSIQWSTVLLYTYATVAFAFFAQFLAGMFLVRKLLASASLVQGGFRESDRISVPMTVGWLRPAIVLPLEWQDWSDEKLGAVLAHEGAHIRRRDGLVAALAGVNRCIFWFHPLAWMLERRLALLAEQACDEASVAALGDRDRYAHLLLEMALVVNISEGRLRRHALTMAEKSHMRQRIESLLEDGREFSKGLTGMRWGIVIVSSIPVLLCAGAIQVDRLPAPLRLEIPRWAAPAPPAALLMAQARPTQPAPAPLAPAPAATSKFEVASIRLAPNCVQPRPGPMSNGRLTIPCLSPRNMIQVAYGTNGPVRNPRIQIIGGPDWYTSDKYDLTAKAEDPSATLDQMEGPMLRTLLEDRFGLKIHRETRQLPVYMLTVAKNGPKMPVVPEGSCRVLDMAHYGEQPAPAEHPLPFCGGASISGNAAKMTIDAKSMTMADLVIVALFRAVDRPVLDRTGLTGMFSVHLEYAPPSAASANAPMDAPTPVDSAPSIFSAVQDQLGLKLTADTGPVEVLVIDHIDRPSEN